MIHQNILEPKELANFCNCLLRNPIFYLILNHCHSDDHGNYAPLSRLIVLSRFEESSLRKDLHSVRELFNYSDSSLSCRYYRFQNLLSYPFSIPIHLQSFLPLAILSIPLAIIMYGAFTGAQLGFWSLPLTVFVWLCPVVQVHS